MRFPSARAQHRVATFLPLLLLLLVSGAGPALAHDEGPAALELAARRGAWDAVTLAIARAEAELDAGRAPGARTQLEVARAMAPADPRVAALAARLALDDGDAHAAESLASLALVRTPAALGARLVRARARVALGDGPGALADFDLATASDPGRAEEHVVERARAARDLLGPVAALAGLEAATRDGAWTPARRTLAASLERALGRAPRPRDVPSGGRERGNVRGRSPAPTGARAVPPTRGPYLQNATPEAISVRWRTADSVAGRVSLGPAGGAYTWTFDETSPRREHEVRVTGLAPETAYAYAVHGVLESPDPPSPARTFRTPPPAGAVRPVRLWAIGDSGLPTLEGSQVRDAYLAWAGERREDLWLLLGDNAYYAGTDFDYQAGLFDQYPGLLARTPLWSTRGNHDVLYAGVANDYYDLFTLPAAGEAGGVPSGTEAWYAFDWGPVHFVCLDSEGSDRSAAGPMVAWLRADLAATTQPWVVAFWHHPPYTRGSHDSDDPGDSGGRMRDMREHVLPVLDSLGVDLVLGGHSHAYERSHLLDGHYGLSGTLLPGMLVGPGDGRPDGDGAYLKPTARTVPHAGVVYAVNGSACQASGGTLDHPAMVISLNVPGSMVIDVDGQRLDARFLDQAGVVRDSFAIVKPFPVAVAPGRTEAGLAPARPTPFSTRTELAFTLASAATVSLDVFDVSGRRVRALARGPRPAGTHRVTWDGRDDGGREVPPGAYVVLLDASGDRQARRLVRVR